MQRKIPEALLSLVNEGESLEKLDLRGWIVLDNMIGPYDEIVIDDFFDRPVRAWVNAVSLINTVSIELITEGVYDKSGKYAWPAGNCYGWFDIVWKIWLIVKPPVDPRVVTLVPDLERYKGMMDREYIIQIESENERCWFGKCLDGETWRNKRVWLKKEFKEKK